MSTDLDVLPPTEVSARLEYEAERLRDAHAAPLPPINVGWLESWGEHNPTATPQDVLEAWSERCVNNRLALFGDSLLRWLGLETSLVTGETMARIRGTVDATGTVVTTDEFDEVVTRIERADRAATRGERARQWFRDNFPNADDARAGWASFKEDLAATFSRPNPLEDQPAAAAPAESVAEPEVVSPAELDATALEPEGNTLATSTIHEASDAPEGLAAPEADAVEGRQSLTDWFRSSANRVSRWWARQVNPDRAALDEWHERVTETFARSAESRPAVEGTIPETTAAPERELLDGIDDERADAAPGAPATNLDDVYELPSFLRSPVPAPSTDSAEPLSATESADIDPDAMETEAELVEPEVAAVEAEVAAVEPAVEAEVAAAEVEAVEEAPAAEVEAVEEAPAAAVETLEAEVAVVDPEVAAVEPAVEAEVAAAEVVVVEEAPAAEVEAVEEAPAAAVETLEAEVAVVDPEVAAVEPAVEAEVAAAEVVVMPVGELTDEELDQYFEPEVSNEPAAEIPPIGWSIPGEDRTVAQTTASLTPDEVAPPGVESPSPEWSSGAEPTPIIDITDDGPFPAPAEPHAAAPSSPVVPPAPVPPPAPVAAHHAVTPPPVLSVPAAAWVPSVPSAPSVPPVVPGPSAQAVPSIPPLPPMPPMPPMPPAPPTPPVAPTAQPSPVTSPAPVQPTPIQPTPIQPTPIQPTPSVESEQLARDAQTEAVNRVEAALLDRFTVAATDGDTTVFSIDDSADELGILMTPEELTAIAAAVRTGLAADIDALPSWAQTQPTSELAGISDDALIAAGLARLGLDARPQPMVAIERIPSR